jgi:RNA polymerase sigma factor (sigma-70 family)
LTKERGGAVLQHVRTLFGVGTVAGLADAQLLERFVTRSGEAAEGAFATLVGRHGPMVLRVCRSILRDEHDAQDAFQATFLILVRRAGAVRNRDSVASWLYGVAYRTACCARTATARRRRHERHAARTMAVQVSGEEDRDDFGPVLHEELGRLPERFRAPIVLCDLEGQTHEQAARQLACPVGTVKSRLARGRGRLRSRLIRRGLTPSAGVLGASLSAGAAPVVVPTNLVHSSVNTAMRLAAGKGAAGAISAEVLSLMKGTMKLMTLARIKVVATVVCIGLAGARAGLSDPDGDSRNGRPSSADAPGNPDSRVQAEKVATEPTPKIADVEITVETSSRIVEVGDSFSYRVLIRNHGPKVAERIQVQAMLAKNIEPQLPQAKAGAGGQPLFSSNQRLLAFPPIDRLVSGQEVSLVIKAKAQAQGLATCRVYLVHDDLDGGDALEDVAVSRVRPIQP